MTLLGAGILSTPSIHSRGVCSWPEPAPWSQTLHNAIIVTDFDVKIQYQNKQRRQIYQFARADWESLNDDFNTLSNKIKTQYNTGACTESLWSTFKNTLTESIDKHIPSKLSSSRCNLPWLNGKLHRLLKQKRRLYKKAKETVNWTNYKVIQKTCRRSMRKAEWEYINNTITQRLQTNNSKPFWKYIKSRKQDNIGVAPLEKNGSLVCDSKEKAEILLDQFQSVFTRDGGSAPPHLDPPQHPIISDININTAEVTQNHQSPQSMWAWPNPECHFEELCWHPSPSTRGHLPTVIGHSRPTLRLAHCKRVGRIQKRR